MYTLTIFYLLVSLQGKHDDTDASMEESEQQMEEVFSNDAVFSGEEVDFNNNDEVEDCFLSGEEEDGGIIDGEAGSDQKKFEPIYMNYGVQVSLPPISMKTPMNIQEFYIGFVDCETEKSTQIKSVVSSTPKTKVKQIQTEKQQVLPFENFTNRQFRAFTGVDKNFVEFLSYRVQSQLNKSRNLSRELKLTLLLVKLKVNPTFAVLAAMFGVCEDTAIKYFYETLDIVAEESRKNIIWFDRPTVKARMPKSFKEHFENARAIIDCTEIETEIPSDVRENVESYSHYKSKHTLKVLIAIAPSGEITFLSKAFGGRCTDTQITVGSGFLNLVEPGDVILADKGFPSIQTDISKAGGILVMPPFKKGNTQFSEAQNQAGYQCASVRVHVERAIERLKRFECLTFVSATCRKNVDKMLQIIAFVANCYTDLINDA